MIALTAIAAGQADLSEDAGVVVLIFDGLLIRALLPIVIMTLATAAFGNELEDRTLSYLTIKPVPRWRIALPKLLASLTVGGPVVILTGVIMTMIAFGLDAKPVAATAAALAVGVTAYAAIFTWAGLVTANALPFCLLYVFIWEALAGALLSGISYLSVRAYSLSVMHAIDDNSFSGVADGVIALPVAVGSAALVIAVFFALTVLRLRRMDTP